MADFRKRTDHKNKKLWVFGSGSLAAFFSLILSLSMLGISISSSGDIYCANECVSYFNISISDYALCFGSTFSGFEAEGMTSYEIYKYNGSWNPYNLSGCLERNQVHEFKLVGYKSVYENASVSVLRASVDWITPMAKIGEKTIFKENKTKKGVKYKDVKRKTLLGYEKVWKLLDITEEICNLVKNNQTGNTTRICGNVTGQKRVLDESVLGAPIYKEELTGLEIMNETFEFVEKGCYPCGEDVLCLSKKDGYSPNRAEEYRCTLRSGESGWIKNLTSGEIIESRTDVGEII